MTNPPSYCENSTITEAWLSIIGMPGPVDKFGASALAHVAMEEIPGLVETPAVAIVTGPTDLIAPFWEKQFSWGADRYAVRFGHRYMSIHFVRRAGSDRYDRFATSLEPWTVKWLELYANALKKAAPSQRVDRIGFGYVNTFNFPLEDFEFPAFFKLDLSLDVEAPNAGLLGLTSSFHFRESTGAYVRIELSAEPRGDETISVVTKVLAELRDLDEVSFADTARLLPLIKDAKAAAKRTFFNFATKRTHDIMGARYDNADPDLG